MKAFLISAAVAVAGLAYILFWLILSALPFAVAIVIAVLVIKGWT